MQMLLLHPSEFFIAGRKPPSWVWESNTCYMMQRLNWRSCLKFSLHSSTHSCACLRTCGPATNLLEVYFCLYHLSHFRKLGCVNNYLMNVLAVTKLNAQYSVFGLLGLCLNGYYFVLCFPQVFYKCDCISVSTHSVSCMLGRATVNLTKN